MCQFRVKNSSFFVDSVIFHKSKEMTLMTNERPEIPNIHTINYIKKI